MTSNNLKELLVDVDDATLASISSLQPSLEEVEEAVVWLDGNGYLFGKSEWPLTGTTGAIYDLLAAKYVN